MGGAWRREVGPGAHYLGCEHTQRNFESAFYRSTVADNKTFEQWNADGATWAHERAHLIWKKLLETYERPPMDPGIDEALQAYADKRREEIRAGSGAG